MKVLLNAGADVNVQGGAHGNALNSAIAGGHTNLAETLLAEGADVNAPAGPYGNALELAASDPDRRLVQHLLDAGADIERVGQFGKPVSAAFMGGAFNIVRSFLGSGCDVSTLEVDIEQWLELGPELYDEYGAPRIVKRLFKRPREAIPTLLRGANQWLEDDANKSRPLGITELEDDQRQMRTYMERACIRLEKMIEADEWEEDEYDGRSSEGLWDYSDSDPECEGEGERMKRASGERSGQKSRERKRERTGEESDEESGVEKRVESEGQS